MSLQIFRFKSLKCTIIHLTDIYYLIVLQGMFRHRGTIMLNTSSSQSINIKSDFSLTATGQRNKGAQFMVHKVDTGGFRMFESIAHPGKYIRLKDGKIDCLVSFTFYYLMIEIPFD